MRWTLRDQLEWEERAYANLRETAEKIYLETAKAVLEAAEKAAKETPQSGDDK